MTRKALFDAVKPFAPRQQFTPAMVAAIDKVAELMELPRDGGTPRTLQNPEGFFALTRKSLFGGKLTDQQVAGIGSILAAIGAAGWSVAWTSDALATAYLETAKSMQPVREAYYLGEPKAERFRKTLRYYPWYGRGLVQATWQENYQRADDALHLNGSLIANPDRMLEPEIAAKTMVLGMSEGWFAKDAAGPHTLARHLPSPLGTRPQFEESRRIINGVDRKADLATYALAFQDALVAGKWA